MSKPEDEKQENNEEEVKNEAQPEEAPAEEPKAAEEASEESTPQEEPKAEEQKKEAAQETQAKEEKPEPKGKDKGKAKIEKTEAEDEFVEQVISIKRITKVTKGGKKLSFSALAVVGDTKGNVGYSLSKASEVATAIRKALTTAKKKMIAVPMRGTTITHEIIGECGGAEVLLKPASEGTGVIASGPVRAVCDGAGIHNILTKCHRSNNPINVVKATIDGLSRLKTVEQPVEAEV